MFSIKELLIVTALFATILGGAVETVQVTDFAGYRFTAIAAHHGSHAQVGGTVRLRVRVNSAAKRRFRVELFVNGDRHGKERTIYTGGEAEYSFTPAAPGVVGVVCTALDADGAILRGPRNRRVMGGIGVLVSPKEIRPGNPDEPADFDAFWKKKRAELDEVPVKELERVEVESDPKFPGVACYDVKVACAGGVPVSGYLCMPKNAKPKSLPAIVKYHGAGVRSAVKRPDYAVNAIMFDVNAHGLPNGKGKKFYSGIAAGKLDDYGHFGFGDERELYFINMFVRVMRALDYVKNLPEWDGKTLIALGQSQGGGQTLAAAALDPQVTLCCANVPALCDLGGRLAKRRPGWPVASRPKFQTDAAVLAKTAYVDGVFFARRIKCPVYMSTGLVDLTCVSTAVFSAFNSIPAGVEKHMYVNPSGNHDTSDSPEGDAAIRAILKAAPRAAR